MTPNEFLRKCTGTGHIVPAATLSEAKLQQAKDQTLCYCDPDTGKEWAIIFVTPPRPKQRGRRFEWMGSDTAGAWVDVTDRIDPSDGNPENDP